MSQLYWRSIFISDVHLGTKNCKADYLLNFLRSTSSQKLYLVGDIFDILAMKKSVHWNQAQTDVLREVFKKAQQGTEVFYIPGNHDRTFRDFSGSEINNVKIRLNVIHENPDGKRYFVSHGDEFDRLLKHNGLLKVIGSCAYDVLLWLDHINAKIRKRFNLQYWSLSSHIKSQVGNANQYIDKYRQAATNKALHNGYEGYICGHIHKSEICNKAETLYCNTGDWVEHCTALVEDENGVLQILHWSDHAKIEVIHRDEEVVLADLPLIVPELFRAA